MPTALVIRFPWGRYHASPWGRHVNEGAVELPPSPWRLLRALYATWQTRVPDLPEEAVLGLLDRLSVPPVFVVPRFEIAHTRHYYPDSQYSYMNRSTDKTLDAFAVVDRDSELVAQWPFELIDAERSAFAIIAEAMPYLGRADSLCEARAEHEWKQPASVGRVWSPVDTAESIPDDAEITSVLAPENPLNLASLRARPQDVRRGGLLFPVGTRLIGYQATSEPVRRRPRAAPAAEHLVHAVRFDVLQAAFPPATDALAYTDLLRSAALSKLGRSREERDRTVLGGRTASGEVMTRQHGHAHYLPVARDGRLIALLVWAPDGFPQDELKALLSVRELQSKINERWRLSLRAAATGRVGNVHEPLVRRSATWISVTPYTPSRFPHKNDVWRTFLGADIRRELAHRGLPAPVSVELVDRDWAAWRRFRPSPGRKKLQGRAAKPSAFLRLRFDEPVPGPLVLGHLSHFGLGLFAPEL